MKKRTIWTKLGDFLEGRGFYIVLALCIVAIGGSGYYLYRMISLSDQLTNQTVSAQASVPAEGADQKTDTEQAVEDAVKAAADRAAAAKAKAEEKTKAATAKTQEKDPTKSAQVLGWKAEKNLEDMCRDSWRWQTQNPMGYGD